MLIRKTYILLHFVSFFFTLLFFTSCKDTIEPTPPVEECRRTVLVYQVANNNLGTSSYNEMDINEMYEGANNGMIPDDCRFLVYNAGPYSNPLLLEIKRNEIDTLKVYDNSALSVSSARMLEVFNDVDQLAPSKEFGLILWSHGTGWLQDGMSDIADNATTLSFGSEKGHTMNVTTLTNVLAQVQPLSFLYFDCCYMASVETLYELKDVAPLIIGSATELLVYGMPYQTNLGCFFAGEASLIAAARNTFNLYDAMQGSSRTCTMSVVRTSELDALAQVTAEIFSRANYRLPELYRPQRFMNRDYSSCWYFDMEDYIRTLCFGVDGSEQFDNAAALFGEYEDVMRRCVLYKASTPRLWNDIDITRHCGMSTYIIDDPSKVYNKNYNSLSWYRDVVLHLKF